MTPVEQARRLSARLVGGTVDRYVMGVALRTITLVAGALVALLSLFDFVEQLGLVGQGRYSVVDALHDMVLTAPSRLLQVAPVSMLLGSLLSLGALARSVELTAMLSLGVSEHRIIRSVMKLVLPATLILLGVSEYIIPPAQRLATTERMAALASAIQPAEGGVWAHDGGQYLNVRHMQGARRAASLDIYSFAPDGQLETVIHAETADLVSDADWMLAGIMRTAVHAGGFTIDHPQFLVWHPFLTRDMLRNLFLPVESLPPIELYQQIRTAARLHRLVPRLDQAFWVLARLPVSMLAMVLLVAPFVFGPARTPKTARNLTRALGFAIAYSLGQQILDHLGLLLRLPPVATALAPPLLAMWLAVWLFQRRLRLR